MIDWIKHWINKVMSKKITALPQATTPLVGNEVFAIVQNGTTVKTSVSALSGGGALGNVAFTNTQNQFSEGQLFTSGLSSTQSIMVGSNPFILGNVQGSIYLTTKDNAIYSGTGNVFVGDGAGTSHSSNTVYSTVLIGPQTGASMSIGGYNTILGSFAASNWTHGYNNTILGANAGKYSGFLGGEVSHNTFIGCNAGMRLNGNSNITIGYNAAIGSYYSTASLQNNIAVGYSAGQSLSSGHSNIFIGVSAGGNSKNSSNGIAIGTKAGGNSFDLFGQVVVGCYAGSNLTSGNNNTFIGSYAGTNTTSASRNVFIGHNSGYSNKIGDSNTFLGSYAGQTNINGRRNTAVGTNAGGALQGSIFAGNGANNTFLGYNIASSNALSGKNNLWLGSDINLIAASNVTSLLSGSIVLGSNVSVISSNELVMGSTTVPLLTNTPSATPATPYTFLQIRLNGQQLKIPLYS